MMRKYIFHPFIFISESLLMWILLAFSFLQPCKQAPTALTFSSCKNLRLENLKLRNSQQIHMSVEDCSHVKLAHLSITAPGTSPNTDGIHIARSRRVHVTDCTIKTGDDCISIEDGTENLHVKNILCGPGHGISIGSLGDHGLKLMLSMSQSTA